MGKLKYWLWLSTKEGLNCKIKYELLQFFGCPEYIYLKTRKELLEQTNLSMKYIDILSDKSLKKAEEVLFDCENLGIDILTIEDSGYPEILSNIDDPPIVLYIKGKLPNLEKNPAISIVGTRKATTYGLMVADMFGKQLANAGFTIVSGMAKGIDATAMSGAISKGGKTIAVFAGGVNICFPPQNNLLMGDILLTGAVISENPPSTPHYAFYFPTRNRIISGLSRATLIVEAPLKSGALITARQALEQGRDVFAVPANINSVNSAGCNRLIGDGEAAMATCVEDISKEIYVFEKSSFKIEKDNINKEQIASDKLCNNIFDKNEGNCVKFPEVKNEEQKIILQLISNDVKTPEDIIELSGLKASKVMTELTMMELDGILMHENGVIYKNFDL